MSSLSSTSPRLYIASIQSKEMLDVIKQTLTEWSEECDDRILQLKKPQKDYVSANFDPPLNTEKQQLANYSNIANFTVVKLEKGIESNAVVAAAYDHKANLQGVSILLFKKSEKGNQFVEIISIIKAFWNMALTKPKSPLRIKEVGSALLAHAALNGKATKLISAIPTEESLLFYKTMGFQCSRKDARVYKFHNKEFEGLIKKQSGVVFCSESDLSAKFKEATEKKED